MDTHRATLHARGIRAVEATLCLLHRLLFRQAQVHLLQAGMASIIRIQLGHLHTSQSRTFCILFALTQCLTPRLGTTGSD